MHCDGYLWLGRVWARQGLDLFWFRAGTGAVPVSPDYCRLGTRCFAAAKGTVGRARPGGRCEGSAPAPEPPAAVREGRKSAARGPSPSGARGGGARAAAAAAPVGVGLWGRGAAGEGWAGPGRGAGLSGR